MATNCSQLKLLSSDGRKYNNFLFTLQLNKMIKDIIKDIIVYWLKFWIKTIIPLFLIIVIVAISGLILLKYIDAKYFIGFIFGILVGAFFMDIHKDKDKQKLKLHSKNKK